MYNVEMVSDDIVYIPSFLKNGTGIQALRFFFNSLRGFRVSGTDGREL
jgi:hypothetical protein